MTALPDGPTTTLLTCLGQHLEDAGVGNWDPDGAYARTDIGIYLSAIPDGSPSVPVPDLAIALTYYGVSATVPDPDETGHTGIAGVQVRCQGTRDPRTVANLRDTVKAVLHGARALHLGATLPVLVPLIWWTSGADLGADSSGRWQTTDNYYAHTAY